MKGKRRECKAEVGAPLAVVVVPRCRGVNEDEKSEATKYYVIIQATWSHDLVLSEKKNHIGIDCPSFSPPLHLPTRTIQVSTCRLI